MNRAERIAKIKRDLAELRSRVGRVQGEAFSLERQIREVEAEFATLAAEAEGAA